jgi:hypothetical protein
MSGKTFGRLTVISRARGKYRGVFWLAACRCGNEKIVNAVSLRAGLTKSCGCIRSEMLSDSNRGKVRTTIRVGHAFGMLTILGKDDARSTSKNTFWMCSCQCGNMSSAGAAGLLRGETKSCGCQGESGFRADKPASLYFFEFTGPNGKKAWKIGITNRTAKYRAQCYGTKEGWSYALQAEYRFEEGAVARDTEKKILKAFSGFAWDSEFDGEPPIANGFTELMSINAHAEWIATQ